MTEYRMLIQNRTQLLPNFNIQAKTFTECIERGSAGEFVKILIKLNKAEIKT